MRVRLRLVPVNNKISLLVAICVAIPSISFAQSGSYDSSADRWRPQPPAGNAFEESRRKIPYRAGNREQNFGRHNNEPDGVSVRELSDITSGRSAGAQSLGRQAWQGMNARRFATRIGTLQLPLRSISGARLFQRLAATPIPNGNPGRFQGLAALRAEVLYRSGLVDVLAADRKERSENPSSSPEAAIVDAVASKAVSVCLK